MRHEALVVYITSQKKVINRASESLFFARKCEKLVPTTGSNFMKGTNSIVHITYIQGSAILLTSSPRSSPLHSGLRFKMKKSNTSRSRVTAEEKEHASERNGGKPDFKCR